MNALERLASMLRTQDSAGEARFRTQSGLEAVISGLQKHNRAGAVVVASDDLLLAAVKRFWENPVLTDFKDARLVSFGLGIPIRKDGPCLFEDKRRFEAVLDDKTGIGKWSDEPRWYRRCYQGLVRSYFSYDGVATSSDAGRSNWESLKDYLKRRLPYIRDRSGNPSWVEVAESNAGLFSDEPCLPYAQSVLNGDSSTVEHLCGELGINQASWFLRELTLAQIRHAASLGDREFMELVPRLCDMVSGNLILRDRGLIHVLNRYSQIPNAGVQPTIQEKAVEWWGNPWLPSTKTRWGGVRDEAREMVADWLKREFIEAFFTKLAEDGVGDRRRANFWLRYAKSMTNVQFALGAHALTSRDKDFVALRNRMKGLITELRTGDSSNNAFVMTLGNLVAVEFGGESNAFYGYDQSKKLPFDLTRPVGTTVDGSNSLKSSRRILWMQHQDGIKGWTKWEQMFEATLKEHFDIKPSAGGLKRAAPAQSKNVAPSSPARNAPASGAGSLRDTAQAFARAVGGSVAGRAGDSASAPTSDAAKKPGHPAEPWASIPYSRRALDEFAKACTFALEDRSDRGGALWVRTADTDKLVSGILRRWGFMYKSAKGWWR